MAIIIGIQVCIHIYIYIYVHICNMRLQQRDTALKMMADGDIASKWLATCRVSALGSEHVVYPKV